MQRPRRMFDEDGDMDFLSSPSRSPPMSSPQSGELGCDLNVGKNCILHPVSRFDTLAGVAIRYGVEVADIKRLNGLSTDLQMFALKTLQIPLPGRHPPSPSICNGHSTPQRPRSAEQSRQRQNDLLDSFQSLNSASPSERKASSAMSRLRGYYGLSQADKRAGDEGLEMSVYHHDGAANGVHDGLNSSSSPYQNPPLSRHRKSRSVANSLMSANGSLQDSLLLQEGESSSGTGSEKWFEKLFDRRRQKSESDFASYPPEKLLKEEVCSSGSTISTITGKGLALRPKSSSRTVLDGEAVSTPSPFSMNLGDSPQATDTSNSVRKSSSTSSLQDADNGTFSSLWPTSKWSLKPDFQALSSAAIPIFDGLPKAIGKKNKTALD